MDFLIFIYYNGGILVNKKFFIILLEIEYWEKGKEKDKDVKKYNFGINNNNIL